MMFSMDLNQVRESSIEDCLARSCVVLVSRLRDTCGLAMI